MATKHDSKPGLGVCWALHKYTMLGLVTSSCGQIVFFCFMHVHLADRENSNGQVVFFIVLLTGDPDLANLMKAFLRQCTN